MKLNIAFSRHLAIIGGIALPVLETIRRWHEWPGPPDTWIFWMDDYFLGAFLLWAAWMNRPGSTHRSGGSIRPSSWLTAAFGFGCGLGFGSALGQWSTILHQENSTDPSGIASEWIVVIKFALVVVAYIGMYASMRGANDHRPMPDHGT
jgi:hypothetical protein